MEDAVRVKQLLESARSSLQEIISEGLCFEAFADTLTQEQVIEKIAEAQSSIEYALIKVIKGLEQEEED